jgi:hypothetical protein
MQNIEHRNQQNNESPSQVEIKLPVEFFAQHSGRLRIPKKLRWIEKTDVDIWALSLSNGSEY